MKKLISYIEAILWIRPGILRTQVNFNLGTDQ